MTKTLAHFQTKPYEAIEVNELLKGTIHSTLHVAWIDSLTRLVMCL